MPLSQPGWYTDINGLIHLTGGAGSANDLASFRGDLGVTSGTGAYAAWADQSGNGNNATQATGSLQPAQSTTINGQKCCSFNGSTALELPAFMPTSGALYFMIAYKLTATPGASTFFEFLKLVSSVPLFWRIAFTNYTLYYSYQQLAQVGISTAAGLGFQPTLDTNPHALVQTYNGNTNTSATSYTTILDGTSETLSVGGNMNEPLITDLAGIGGRILAADTVVNGAKIDIAELHIGSGTPSAGQLSAITNNWTARYGLVA